MSYALQAKIFMKRQELSANREKRTLGPCEDLYLAIYPVAAPPIRLQEARWDGGRRTCLFNGLTALMGPTLQVFLDPTKRAADLKNRSALRPLPFGGHRRRLGLRPTPGCS